VDDLRDRALGGALNCSGATQESLAAAFIEEHGTDSAGGEAGGDGFASGESALLAAGFARCDVALAAGAALGIEAEGGGS
jgi:hypothetical protein